MDKLEQAMQSEDFWVEIADTSFGQVVLHGKNTNSTAGWNDNVLDTSTEKSNIRPGLKALTSIGLMAGMLH